MKTIKLTLLYMNTVKIKTEMLFNMNTWSVRWGSGKPEEGIQECRHATGQYHLSSTLASQMMIEDLSSIVLHL